MPSGHARVFIVDDSAVMRSLLRSVVLAHPALEVAGTAADGASALHIFTFLKPDLVLLDVEMPVMDGLATLRELRRRGHRMPVIVCSSLTQRGARVTLDALAGGASDYVAKPFNQPSREAAFQALSQELIPKILALTGLLPAPPAAPPRLVSIGPAAAPQPLPAAPRVVAIGVSTGGPAALDVVLPGLPHNFALPVLVVQHMPEVFTHLLAERLNESCPLAVQEACEGLSVAPGNVYIARGNWHMEAQPPASPAALPTLHLTQGALENHCRPAVDAMLRSAVRVYGSGVLAVILTGMGADGLAGCRAVREAGGTVLAQDQPTSTIWGMPGAVANAGLALKVLPLGALSAEIQRIANRPGVDVRPAYRMVV